MFAENRPKKAFVAGFSLALCRNIRKFYGYLVVVDRPKRLRTTIYKI